MSAENNTSSEKVLNSLGHHLNEQFAEYLALESLILLSLNVMFLQESCVTRDEWSFVC